MDESDLETRRQVGIAPPGSTVVSKVKIDLKGHICWTSDVQTLLDPVRPVQHGKM